MTRFSLGLVLCLFLAVLLCYPLFLFLRSSSTEFQMQEAVKVVGTSTPVRLVAINPHGVRRLEATLQQGGRSFPVFEESRPPLRWSLFRNAVSPQSYAFDVGTKKAAGLRDGKAMLVLEAVSNDLRGRTDKLSIEIEVNTQPPGAAVDEGEHHITLGGAEVVTFTASGYWTEAGVRVGKYTFRSFPHPSGGGVNRRIAFFAYPYDSPEGEVPYVFVRNPTGAEALGKMSYQVKRRKFRTREINLTDAFLEKIFRELDPGGSGHPLNRFAKINVAMRQANNQAMSEFRLKTDGKILWSGPFLQLANSSVEAQFCDYRRYIYRGQQVDEQVHLGFDLAVTARSPVAAANDGTVVYAAPLGIYGNLVVIDHGLGIQSIYAHLSEFGAKPGDTVKKGQTIGKSGATGLAGGDHLHFGMLVDGIPSNPIEWWDGHWLHDRVEGKLR